jgi:hypothetical protein
MSLSVCLMLGACATLPNPFGHGKADYKQLPADTVRDIAMQVEKAVQEGNRDAQIADKDGVTVNTAQIMQAIKTRAARSELVNAFLDSGHGIENANGHLYVIRNRDYKNATTSRDRDRNAAVVTDEAADRWTIYEGIVEANHFPRRSLPAIQQIFHEARVQAMKDGQKYEGPSGETLIKGQ